MKKVIAIIKGDGIGHEVVEEGIKILKIISKYSDLDIELREAPAGADVYKEYGTPLPNKSYETVKESDAILFGAIGRPEVPPGVAEKATFIIRQGLNMYVNLRPIKLYEVIKDCCPLKEEYIGKGIDISFIRENSEGVYSGFDHRLRNEVAQTVNICTRMATERIVKYAFEFAGKKGHQIVSSVDKANVMEASRFWRQIFHEISEDYPDMKTEDFYMDAFSLWLIRAPYRFQTVVTDNLYGDIVTDQAAILIGSLGMAPSGNINPEGTSMYEPSHGSAPDIAGKNIANPTATILSVKLMMEETFKFPEIAIEIEKSVIEALGEGRTVDLKNQNLKTLSTIEMGNLIAEKLVKRLKK